MKKRRTKKPIILDPAVENEVTALLIWLKVRNKTHPVYNKSEERNRWPFFVPSPEERFEFVMPHLPTMELSGNTVEDVIKIYQRSIFDRRIQE